MTATSIPRPRTEDSASGHAPESDGISRRSLVRYTVAGSASVLVPSKYADVVQVARGATSSGHVELTTTSTIPTDTSIDIRVFEDLDGDSTAETQESQSISGGTDVVTEYQSLDGTEGGGHEYWMEITLSTTDDSVTPELDAMTITLPETMTTPDPTDTPGSAAPGERQSAEELWDTFLVFVAVAIGAMGALAGLGSRSMALGGFAAYMVFAHIAVETGHQLLINILYVTLVLVIIGMAFKLWRLEFGGNA